MALINFGIDDPLAKAWGLTTAPQAATAAVQGGAPPETGTIPAPRVPPPTLPTGPASPGPNQDWPEQPPPVWQVPAGTTAPTSNPKAPRVIQRNGQWILTEHGNERILSGQEITDAQNYVTDFWTKFPTGYQPGETPSPTPTPTPAAPTFNLPWLATLMGGLPATPGNLVAKESVLNQLGVTVLRNADGVAGKIRLPDGTIVDVIQSAGTGGGGPWQWLTGTNAGLPGVPGVTTGPGVNMLPTGTDFTDPSTQQLVDFIKFRLGELYQPVNDPFREQYGSLLQQRTDQLSSQQGDLKTLLDVIRQRFGDLQTPGYTGAEQEVIRTSALDPIERDRAAAKQRMLEHLGARGLTPDSGIAQEALLRVDAAFDANRSTAQRDIALNEMQRRDARAQQAISAGTMLTDIPDARSREALDTASALSTLSGSVRGEEQSRRDQALSLIGMLAEMPAQSLKTALAALGQGETPGSYMNSLVSILGANTANRAVNTQNSASFWSGLGSLAALLAKGGGATTGGNYTTITPQGYVETHGYTG